MIYLLYILFLFSIFAHFFFDVTLVIGGGGIWSTDMITASITIDIFSLSKEKVNFDKLSSKKGSFIYNCYIIDTDYYWFY